MIEVNVAGIENSAWRILDASKQVFGDFLIQGEGLGLYH